MNRKSRLTSYLLTCGIIAPLMLGAVSYALALSTPGFDLTRHANSQLVLGQYGWVQTANFILAGLLVMAFAVGARRALKGKPGGLFAPLLIAIYGLFAAVIVGLHPTDPQFGFPPGTPLEYAGFDQISLSAKIHGIAGMIGFSALTIATFAFARYFAWMKQTGWSALSFLTGIATLGTVIFLQLSAGKELTSFNYIPVWAVGTLIWLYLSATAWKIRRNYESRA